MQPCPTQYYQSTTQYPHSVHALLEQLVQQSVTNMLYMYNYDKLYTNTNEV
jgi:hypothetical protein